MFRRLLALIIGFLLLPAAAAATGYPHLGAPDHTPAGPCVVYKTVDNTTMGTFRYCLQNVSSGDTILFDTDIFPPAAPATISVLSGLPDLDDGNVTLDASDAGVILDGGALTAGECGLRLTSGGNRVMGLQILNFPGDGIQIVGSAGWNVVGGDRATGSGPSGQGNVISGNGGHGVLLSGSEAAHNVVQGNIIGADASGTAALTNGGSGVAVRDGATYNTVGGDTEGERNLIVANINNGVYIGGAGTSHNVVAGNWIGFGLNPPAQGFPADQALSPDFASDQTIYVASLIRGMLKSADAGVSWVEVNNGLADGRLLQVAIPPDATGPATAFALAEDGDLYRTDDGGANWSLVTDKLGMIDRRNIAFSADFANDSTLYAAAWGWAGGDMGDQPGVFVSHDGGVSWSWTSGDMASWNVQHIYASPDDRAPGVLFALTAAGIARSTDGGAHWDLLAFPGSGPLSLAISPDYYDDETIYVSAGNLEIYKSTDGGDTWSYTTTALWETGYIGVSPDYSDGVAGVVCHGAGWNWNIACSADWGATWTAYDTHLPGPRANEATTDIAFSPDYANDHTLTVISISGMSLSTDGGASFTVVRGLHDIGHAVGVAIQDGATENTIGPDNTIGNNNFGVSFWGADTAYNVVLGNHIGVDPAGTGPLANSDHALAIWSGHDNLIGGDSEAERNVIASTVWGNAVLLHNSETMSNTVSGNYIGVDATGAAVFAGRGGVSIGQGASYNIIGGDTAGTGNVISGHDSAVQLYGTGTVSNTVQGNIIGPDAAGSAILGNRDWAVRLHDGAHYNVIADNLLSGNGGGVGLWGSDVAYNRVSGNLIGLDISGRALLGSQDGGIELGDGAHDNLIGGQLPIVSSQQSGASGRQSAAGVGNVIAGLNKDAIQIRGSDTRDNTVSGNIIGADMFGEGYLPNGGHGVYLQDAGYNLIGGDAGEERNLIVANRGHGVYIEGSNAVSNAVQGNWIGLGAGTAAQRFPVDQAVSPDYATDCTLFVATQTSGVYKSTDCGASWAPAVNGLGDVRMMQVEVAACGSPDCGPATSAQVKLPDHSPAAAAGYVLFAVDESRHLYVSTDAGEHWTLRSTMLEGIDLRTLVISADFAHDDTLYAAAQNWAWESFGNQPGVFVSHDGGATWGRTAADPGNLNVWKLVAAPDPAAAGVLFALTNGGIERSDDGGATWGVVALPDGNWNDLGVSPNYSTDHTIALTAYSSQVYFSYDGGATWPASAGSPRGDPRFPTFAPDYATSGQFCHGGGWNDQIYCTSDFGAHWTVSDTGLFGGLDSSRTAIAFAPDYATSGALTMISAGGIARSTDRGASWQVLTGLRQPGNYAGVSISGGATYARILDNTVSNNGVGIAVDDGSSGHNTISGNRVGTDPTAAFGQANLDEGIRISSGDNALTGNVVSANLSDGIRLPGSDATGNVVAGNRVGTNAAGTAALGNRGAGVSIYSGAHHNLIGGDDPAERNLISGNYGNGIILYDPGTAYNQVFGNIIGLNADGNAALGNGNNGVELSNGPHDNVIGGDTLAERNVIVASGNMGISLHNGAHHNTIKFNFIGTNDYGGAALGNSNHGISFHSNASDNVVGPNNVIAYNQIGVGVADGDTLRDTITENSIYANRGPGIQLYAGGNAGLAAPRVLAYNLAAGTASGTACAFCTVEIFSADDEEGRVYEGTTVADEWGNWSFSKSSQNSGIEAPAGLLGPQEQPAKASSPEIVGPASGFAGPHITATATDGDGNTSPFSPLFDLLVVDLGVQNTFYTLDNLGLAYDRVAVADFGTVDLGQYDVLFVGFTGNDPQPADLLLPLVNRRDDIVDFVQAGGGLVANSEDGVVATDYDWQWVPVDVTHTNRGGDWVEFPDPAHLLLQGLTVGNLAEWPLFHNTFTAWDWPAAEVLMRDANSGDAVVLAGSLDAGRMVFSGADPDFHTSNWSQSTEQMLYNELCWAAGMLADTLPRVAWTSPGDSEATAANALIRVQFNEMLDAATVGASTFSVVGSDSGAHTGTVTYMAESAQAAFVPAISFTVGEEVTVRLAATVEDLTGNGLDGDGDGVSEGSPADDYVWSFTIRGGDICLVSSTADDGPDTLRRCLGDAQPADTICFDPAVFPPDSPATIAVTSGQLPDLWRGYITVDASGAGDCSAAGVILEGSALSPGADGLGVTSDGNAVYGLEFRGFPGDGIEIRGWGNVIGAPLPLAAAGAGGRGNVMRDCGQNGIRLWGSHAQYNTVQGNVIGADASGTVAALNWENGISLEWGADHNLIGGPAAGEGNIVFANRQDGVHLWRASDNIVQGNRIGLGHAAIAQNFPTDQALSPAYATDGTIYLATRTSGVLVSTDSGASWAPTGAGLPAGGVLQVEIPPGAADASTAYALMDSGSLYVTTDSGASWTWVSDELGKIDRRNLALSATFGADATMYASAQWWSSEDYGGQPGVFKSTDGGVTWAHADTGIPDNHVYKVIASPDPAAAGVLFALTNSGIARSDDGGASWVAAPAPGGGWLADLALSPAFATDHTVFVAEHGGPGRIHRSTDGGVSWTFTDALRGDPRQLALSPDYASDGTVCHGGGWNDWAYCSTDRGATWTGAPTGLSGGLNDAGTAIAFAPDFATSGEMFVVSEGGISRSTDRGASWRVQGGLRQRGNGAGIWLGWGSTGNALLDNVTSNNHTGVVIQEGGAVDNVVGGNIAGLDPTGMFQQANLGDGIQLNVGPNVVGGAAGPNIVSGNLVDGIRVAGSGATGVVIAGNTIGLNAAGAALGNRGAGVSIHSGATYTLVGGDDPAERNLISGNGYGIGIWDSDTGYNTVSGNYIGVDATGAAAVGNGDGVRVTGGSHHNVIGGATAGERNVISGNGSHGVYLGDGGTGHNRVIGNYIGVDATGLAGLGNGGDGVNVGNGAANNAIGGLAAGEGNVISGNGSNGIGLYHPGTDYNTVAGNWIGIDAAGAAAIGNGNAGIHANESSHSLIRGNVISGNAGNGIDLCCSATTSYNTVAGNKIGTNPAGTAALPNANDGIHMNVGDHNVIGGDTPAEANLISGNGVHGISINNGTHHNQVQGNIIGLDAAGAALPNGTDGVIFFAGVSDNILGPNNVIAFNRRNGVSVHDDTSLRNTITGNSIHSNGLLGIDLWGGGNTELAAPVIAEVTLATCRVTGTACAGCTVEVFSDAADEGRWHEGTTTAAGDGAWSFTKGSACGGTVVRATATDADGNTSEFSPQPLAPAAGMRIVTGGLELRWTELEEGLVRYEVHRSTSPYFLPTGGTWLADVGPVGVGNAAAYVDEHAFDEPLTNYYYIVLAVKDGEVKSPVTGRGGLFHFGLTPGG